MSAETLRRAAALLRTDCPIPEQSRGNDFIDFPTGFAIQGQGGIVHSSKCSGAQTRGALLCDCEAIYPAWRRWRTLLKVASWLDHHARHAETSEEFGDYDERHWQAPLVIARTYLGEPHPSTDPDG